MRFRWLVLWFFCGCSLTQKDLSEGQLVQNESPGFFVVVPILGFSSTKIPCLNVEVEGQQLLVKLDLGFRGNLSVEKTALDSICSKVFIGEKFAYGIRGKKYREKLYRIPKAKIGSMIFSPPTVQEENQEFLKDALFIENGKDEPPERMGRLGWELFSNSNLFIDTQRSQIAFCESLDDLKRQGYAIETFVKAPLFLERGLVEIEADGPNGVLRCVLDTGTTWSILNEELEEKSPMNLAIWEDKNTLKYSSLKIGNLDVGATIFHRISIHLPIHIEAILGMDFFENHLVFLDFKRSHAYIAKNPQKSLLISSEVNPKLR